jgi:L-glutamine-phosphate cytidylyltransferase
VKGIIIGAGRGRRLMPLTDETPKCFAEIGGRRLLDWALQAFTAAGIEDVVFIGGYQIERVRAAYPGLTYCHNRDWERNNILASLFHAEEHMSDGFICAYSDILYTPQLLQSLHRQPGEITLVSDTEWRARYAHRLQHPEDDAEKIRAEGERVVAIGRSIPAVEADGEYIGVAQFSPRGAEILRDHYHRSRASCDGRPFQSARSFETAYLIDLFQEMLDHGEEIRRLDTRGEYMEIDTTEDYELALAQWTSS